MRTAGKVLLCVLLVALACAGTAFAAGTCCAAETSCGAAAAVPDNTLTSAEQAGGWQLLFDGKTFNGWGCTDKSNQSWIIENGSFGYTVKDHGYLYTKNTYSNYELKLDFMVEKGSNSGVFFHWTNLDDPVQTGIEIQVLDSAGKKNPDKHDCGAIYDCLAPRENTMKPAMEWNTMILRSSGKYVSITLNGKRIVNMDLDKWTEAHKNPDGTPNKFDTAYKDMPRTGHIGLQAHGSKVWYKNIKIREF